MQQQLRIFTLSLVAVGSLACDPAPNGAAQGRSDEFVGAAEDDATPELAACGALPDAVEPVAGLATAFAVTGPRSAELGPEPTDPSVVRLRVSSWSLAEDAPVPGYASGFEELGEGWFFALDLPASALVPGVYQLADLPGGIVEGVEETCTADGCGGGGGGGGPFVIPDGELEIFAADEGCVIGEIRGTDPLTSLGVRNGGFAADRVELDCVTVADYPCE